MRRKILHTRTAAIVPRRCLFTHCRLSPPIWQCFLAGLIFLHGPLRACGIAENDGQDTLEVSLSDRGGTEILMRNGTQGTRDASTQRTGHNNTAVKTASISSAGHILLAQDTIPDVQPKHKPLLDEQAVMQSLTRKEALDHSRNKLEVEHSSLVNASGNTAASEASLVNTTETVGSSFTLEFRATAISLVLFEASCMFLTDSSASEERRELHAGPLRQTRLQPLALQPIRFLGIVIIVLHHEAGQMQWHDLPFVSVFQLVQRFFLWGDVWVQFFFALSGFVLYLSQDNAPKVASSRSFISKRFCSMYPSYLASTLLGIVAAKEPHKIFSKYVDGHVLPGFLMIDSWASPYLYEANMPAWFVCALFFSWLCFPRWYRFIRHLEYPWRALVLAWLSTFALPLVHTARWFHLTWDEPGGGSPPGFFTFYHPLGNWQQFVFGMCLARIATEVHLDSLPCLVRQMAASISLVVLMLICFVAPLPPNDFMSGHQNSAPNPLKLFVHKGPLLLPLFAACLIFVPAGDDLLLQPHIMQRPWMLWLGRVSAELYMFHYPVHVLVHNLMNSFDPSSVFLTVCVQFAAAVAFNKFQNSFMDFLARLSGWSAGVKTKSGMDLEKLLVSKYCNPH